MSLSHKQARAARAILGLEQAEVSIGTGISRNQISKFEKGDAGLSSRNLQKLLSFYQTRGVQFTEDEGIRLRPGMEKREYKGQVEFRAFFDDIYETAKAHREINIFNGVPDLLVKWLGEEWYDMHAARMRKIKKLDVKAIVEHGEKNLIGSNFAKYKWFPKSKFHKDTIYIYGDKVAFINFDDEVRVLVIHQKDIAQSQRILFNIAWGSVAEDIPRHVY